MKALSNSSWGEDRETLKVTFKAINESVMAYAAPVWFPNLSRTRSEEIQRTQNQALRSVTGCLQMTDINDLHNEAEVLPFKEHSDMLCKQFSIKCLNRSRPNFHLAEENRPPRNIRPSFMDKYREYAQNRLEEIEEVGYTSVIKKIHTEEVKKFVTISNHPKVLCGEPAPNVDDSEKTLPRCTRVTLAQLRAGYSSVLNSYRARISEDVEDKCPNCKKTGHDTAHLFRCSAKPTSLTVESLWTSPVEVANFLGR